MALLQVDEVDAEMRTVPQWVQEGDSITRTYTAETFLAGLDLVAAVGAKAEEADHHPDIDIRWRTLTFTLSTHSDGGLTAKDFALAREIDTLIS